MGSGRAATYGAALLASDLDSERVTTFVADQSSVADLERVVESIAEPRFDVVIDDGSHRPDHQQVSLGTLFPYVKPSGLYIIEDLLDNGIDGIGRERSAVRYAFRGSVG